MLTDPGDLVMDPFAGSCVTGEVTERLNRNWICVELREDYVEGAKGRFVIDEKSAESNGKTEKFYKLARPGLLWNGADDALLTEDGGKKRQPRQAINSTRSNGVETDRSQAAKDEVTKPKAARSKVAKTEAATQYQEFLW